MCGGDVFVAAVLVSALVNPDLELLAGAMLDGEFDDFGVVEGGGDLAPAEAFSPASICGGELEVVESFVCFGVGGCANADHVVSFSLEASKGGKFDLGWAPLLDGHDEGDSGFVLRLGEVVIELGEPFLVSLFFGLILVDESEVGCRFFALGEEGAGATADVAKSFSSFGIMRGVVVLGFNAGGFERKGFRGCERYGEGLTSNGEVLLKLIAGEEEGGAGGVETGVDLIGGEVGDIGADAEEIFEGVLVFAAVEAAKGDDAAGVGEDTSGRDHLDGEIAEEIGFFFGSELILFLGGHFAGVDGVEDLLPAFGGLYVFADFKGEVLEVHASFLGRGVVTIEAVVFQNIQVLLREDGLGVFGEQGLDEEQGREGGAREGENHGR